MKKFSSRGIASRHTENNSFLHTEEVQASLMKCDVTVKHLCTLLVKFSSSLYTNLHMIYHFKLTGRICECEDSQGRLNRRTLKQFPEQFNWRTLGNS